MSAARELWRRAPWMTGVAAAHGVLLLVLLLAIVLDPAQLLGVNRWIKPAKFAASIAIYLGALAWYAPVLGDSKGKQRAFLLIALAMAFEQVIITIQAARMTTSHYNIATVLDGALFQTMGIWIVINTVAVAWCGWLAWRAFRSSGDAYELGIAMGFTLLLLGSAVGGVMIGHNAHTIGAADGGPGLPFVNWSLAAGDLRVSHFVGIHALQALPLIATLAGRRAMLLVAGLWLALTLGTLWQALQGRPLLGG